MCSLHIHLLVQRGLVQLPPTHLVFSVCGSAHEGTRRHFITKQVPPTWLPCKQQYPGRVGRGWRVMDDHIVYSIAQPPVISHQNGAPLALNYRPPCVCPVLRLSAIMVGAGRFTLKLFPVLLFSFVLLKVNIITL